MLLMLLSMLGTFLVNYVPKLALFHSCASQYFVSSSFCHGFSIAREALSRSLRVSIPDERPVSATDISGGCVLDIFCVGYLIDHIPIAMGDVCVTVGMNLLSQFGALIDCE